MKKPITILIIILLLLTTVPMVSVSEDTEDNIEVDFERYDKYNICEITNLEDLKSIPDIVQSEFINIGNDNDNFIKADSGLMDSAWPMYCHDTHHTGRSPFSTADNPGDEIWKFKQPRNDYIRGSPVVADDGTIYVGGTEFYAVNSDGTLKWRIDVGGYVWSAPAIDQNGCIYIGLVNNFADSDDFYAFNPDGSVKWIYGIGNHVYSSPAIGEDGTIYFGDGNKYINALYPNGTLKWKYKTGHVVYSSPAIGNDGTIYCGSHDENLYALYPNGTLKWKYKTGHWVRVSPCIADDGTIYTVSLDSHLHAVNPNGTMKWKKDVGAGTSPTIGQDGTVYVGYTNLYAMNPEDGSVKWTFYPGPNRKIRGATPCNSVDGTIYFGTHIGDYGGGEIIAVNSNGVEKWRRLIANEFVDSAPAICEDGTVYIGSACDEEVGSGQFINIGFLHAFNRADLQANTNGPYINLINEQINFNGFALGGYKPYGWHWNFGDSDTSELQNTTHTYTNSGNYTVVLTVTDDQGNTTASTTWAIIRDENQPPNKPTITGDTTVNVDKSYQYTFRAVDPEDDDLYYLINWGDGTSSDWIGPLKSGEEIKLSHSWSEKETYSIKAKARDLFGDESEIGTLDVTVPITTIPLFLQILERIWERFPNMFPVLKYLFNG